MLIHYLNDGCSHVFSAKPLPMSYILDTLPMPLGREMQVEPKLTPG